MLTQRFKCASSCSSCLVCRNLDEHTAIIIDNNKVINSAVQVIKYANIDIQLVEMLKKYSLEINLLI